MKQQEFQEYAIKIGKQAKKASRQSLLKLSSEQKNYVLSTIHQELKNARKTILEANQHDLNNGKKNQLRDTLMDRLALNDKRFDQILDGIQAIININDPIGGTKDIGERPSGIHIYKIRVPIGVVGIIYESRPNVTVDAATLCFKSSNACILRGGSEAINSNLALAQAIKTGLKSCDVDPNCVQVIEYSDRSIIKHLVSNDSILDVIIPRGGEGLIRSVTENSRVPVLKHLHGVCHTYVDEFADLDKAISISENAKTRRYGVCNAMETLLVHQKIANKFLPKFLQIMSTHGVEVRGCNRVKDFDKNVVMADENDWYAEYLAPILSIKIVSSLAEAIQHINDYGSAHTDAIITDSKDNANAFITQVDSSSVMHNTSTAFADGFEYGLGAEIGISTAKLHARGPIGLEGLTSEKYLVTSDGAIRQ